VKSTPENAIKKMALLALGNEDCYHWAASAGPYTVNGVADRIGVSRGRFFAIEFKKPGGKPTALQMQFKEKVEAHGGKWFLVDGEESLMKVLWWLHADI
jgi:hypothetical protein